MERYLAKYHVTGYDAPFGHKIYDESVEEHFNAENDADARVKARELRTQVGPSLNNKTASLEGLFREIDD